MPQAKLKVQLKLSISRLRMVQQKDSAKSKQARREMAQLLEVLRSPSSRLNRQLTYLRSASSNPHGYVSKTSSAQTSQPNSTRSSNSTANSCSRARSSSNQVPQPAQYRSIPPSKKPSAASSTPRRAPKSKNCTPCAPYSSRNLARM